MGIAYFINAEVIYEGDQADDGTWKNKQGIAWKQINIEKDSEEHWNEFKNCHGNLEINERNCVGPNRHCAIELPRPRCFQLKGFSCETLKQSTFRNRLIISRKLTGNDFSWLEKLIGMNITILRNKDKQNSYHNQYKVSY